MEEITNTKTINIDLLRELLGNRVQVIRQKQTVTFDEALATYLTAANMVVPDYVIDKDNQFAIHNMIRWLISDNTMQSHNVEGHVIAGDLHKGLYIQGPTGTGKSLALDILRCTCKYYDLQFKCEGKPVYLSWKTARAEDICYDYEESGALSMWKTAPIICIQDFGSEPVETIYMGNRRRITSSIIEARGDLFSRITLISSNIPFAKIAELYGDRVASRLTQMCNIITLGGQDRRKK